MITKYLKFVLGMVWLFLGVFALQAQTPGGVGKGVSNAYTWTAWFTPDTYNNGVWTNRITTAGTVGNFTQPSSWTTKTPPAKGTMNFNNSVQFRPTAYDIALNRMMSDNMIDIAANEAFTIIIIYNATQQNWSNGNILNFSTGSNYANEHNVTYNSNSSNTLSAGWTTSARSLGAVPFGTTQMVTIDNNNNGINGINWYLAGALKGSTNTTNGSANTASGNNYKIVVGGSHWDLTGNGERSFIGDIAEIIILKRPRTTNPFMDANDLKKIHSYLAFKYGITLADGNYVNSAGAPVWTRSNDNYNNNIFGIGHDNALGLYQKQSRSANSGLTTLFTGDKVTTLNSQNTGSINDGSFVMLGSNGAEGTELRSVIANGAQYKNDIVAAINGMNIQSKTIYKAQVTNYTDMVKLAVDMSEYLYVMVSPDESFTPANTNIYPIKSGIAEVSIDNTYKYIRYAGYSGAYSAAMPGGITNNNTLRLWLNAENESSLAIDYVNNGSGALTGYTGAYGSTVLPAGALPAVREWNDLVRSAKYEYISSISGMRMPVLHKKPMETNYHPSVQFWGDNNNTNAFLVNNTKLMTAANPTNKQQTLIIVSNNNDPYRDSSNDRTWFMGFGTTGTGSGFGSTASLSPGYGIKRPSSSSADVYAAINTNDVNATAMSNGNTPKVLFNVGSTSVLTWRTHQFSNSNLELNFNIDGMSSGNIRNGNNNAFAMNGRSTLGVAYQTNRQTMGLISEVILFEEELTNDNLSKIESYLGIKYGVTLRENTSNSTNYDYKMSDGAVFWAGKSPLFKPYHNNVAAVIRDDAATLHNQQAHSTDLGSILHMGVAGTKLGFTSGIDDIGDLEYDKEVIVWGSNSVTGITSTQSQACGDFENIFKKKWLVHKNTHGNRPITMLVGAQNNSINNLGAQALPAIKEMYSKLGAGYDVFLIVGDSETNIDNHIYRAVVPMSFIDGEHQCSYTFTDEITYVTFGYKENRKGCTSVEFSGKKTVDWKAWSRYNYTLDGTVKKEITPKMAAFNAIDLGDDVKVTKMQITYDQNVRSANYYPITGNSPFKGGLQLRRNRGVLNSSKVTVTVEFNHPVIPSFSIAGLDAYWNQYDAVQIYGSCSGSGVLPTLSYAGNPKNARYTITGNKATVNKNTRSSSTDVNSRVNIDFEGGVERIVIEYTITNQLDQFFYSNQEIYISPITLSPIPSPPPINEDGLSFVKEVKERNITTCEPVEYSFYIQNTNCEDKYVHFSDTLPAGMKWVDASLALDSMNWLHNNKLNIINYGGTKVLDIDSLLIPGTKTLKFKVTAVLDKTGPGGKYNNRASIVYHKLVQTKPEKQILKSRDRETLKDFTWFNATFSQRQDTALVTAVPSPRKYAAKSDITVTYTVENPNAAITDVFLDIAFDANFKYKASAFSSSLGTAAQYVTPADPNNPGISIAGSTNGASGFTLPTGTSTFTFTLTAPEVAGLAAINGKTSDLTINYEFSTTQNDPCVSASMSKLSGIMNIPYNHITHIITNKNVTTKIVETK